ncbi:ATP synthase F1 subunit gamma [Candidatus Uhrbacteria bacterium]|nr:ATP synthase F1 subunit gamma [Candidatus Uhrbacteria bacterium]
MPKGALTIRRQMKSITNTKKMTKAMEMVSASKMRKSISAVSATRPYATHAWEMLTYLSGRVEKLHPLLAEREVKNAGFILISTNRGLCGGFNNALVQLLLGKIREEKHQGVEKCEIFTLGKRARDFVARYGHRIVADFPKNDITVSIQDILPLMHLVSEQYISGELDKVYVVTTEFVSTMRQKAVCKQLLPFTGPQAQEVDREATDFAQFLFEPSDKSVLEFIIPRIVEMQVFKAVLESEASEHSARMMAMHNASEAATDMLFDLRLTYNQARQASITQEISEISSGKAALE